MKYHLIVLSLLISETVLAQSRRPSQSSTLQDRIRSEFGIDLPCHYQLTGANVAPRLVDITQETTLESCREQAASALQGAPAGYRQARVKSYESMEWIILNRK